MEFNHINIRAPLPELEKEKQFFCDILGLTIGFRPQFNNQGYWLYDGDKPIIHLTIDEEARQNKGYIDHLAFQSSHSENFISTLNQLKIKYTTSYIEELQTLQVFFKSPLGIRIEVQFISEKA
jgi:extradiol dioxygenase family protein